MHKQVIKLSRLFPFLVLLAVIVIPVIYGCSRETADNGKIVATVNKEPLKLEDFQREIAFRSKQNPSYKITPVTINEQMNTIIDRRLMIQEAMKMGLTGNKDFVRTIQTFWEQTLIRELIEAKNKEWEKRLFVTEQEIRDYYENMKYRVSLKFVRADNKVEAGILLDKALKGEALNWQTLGPVNYNDVLPSTIGRAFEMQEGKPEILKDEKGFMVVSLGKKDVIDLPAFETISSELKKDIIQQKRTDALETWLKEVREKAVIDVNNSLLNASYEKDITKQGSHSGQNGEGNVR